MKKKVRNRKSKKISRFSVLIFLLALLVLMSFFKFPKQNIISPVLTLGNQNSSKTRLEELLNKQSIRFEKISDLNQYLELKLNDSQVVYISSGKDLKKQVSSLQLIVNRLTIEGKRFKSLDFRFDKPVILFWLLWLKEKL